MSVRTLLKSAVEQVLGHPALALSLGRSRTQAAIILAYHNVTPGLGGESGDRSLHLGFDKFRRQLDLLSSRLQLRSLDDILTNSFDGPAAAITFDDAYESACLLALPELEQRRIPSTVFVAPGLIGRGVPWWDRLADSLEGMTESTRRYCLDQLGGRADTIGQWYPEESSVGSEQERCRISQEGTLHAIRSNRMVTVGAHSLTHANLCRASDLQLQQELEEPMHWLPKTFPLQFRPWLAFPYGLFTDHVNAKAKHAGYERTFAIRGGWFQRDTAPPVLPRLNIPAGMSPGGLAARLNGFLL